MIDTKAFIERQNRFRGLISDFKSRGFVKDRKDSPTRTFRYGLRELLLNARADLHKSQFEVYITWTNRQIAKQLPELSRQPVAYDELVGVIHHTPEVTLEMELLWITARIKGDAKRVNVFREAANNIEILVFVGHYEQAIQALQLLESAFGATFWGIQLRIALEQLAGGLERQKRYVAEVRGVYKRGLLGFITYHTSVLNEEKTTLSKFEEDIRQRISKHQFFDDAVKTYARYRVAGELPKSEISLADILRVEQSHSTLDLYETFVAIVQEICRRQDLVDVRGVAAKCIASLERINDFRLKKAAHLLDVTSTLGSGEIRSTEISDALFRGEKKRAIRAAYRVIESVRGVDPWQILYAGIAFAGAEGRQRDPPRDLRQAPLLLGQILSPNNPHQDSLPSLRKMVTNLRNLPVAVGILEILSLLRRSSPNEPWRPWLIGLNSRTQGVEELTELQMAGQEVNQDPKFGPTAVAWAAYGYTTIQAISDCDCDCGSGSGVKLLAAAGMLRRNCPEQASTLLDGVYRSKGSESLGALTALLLLHAYCELGEKQKVVELIAEEGSRAGFSSGLIPVAASLEGYRWLDYKRVEAPLAAILALHLLWSSSENDATASQLRFATSVFLKNPGIGKPSRLFDLAHAYPRSQLIYFLKLVCVPQILDVSRVVKGTREVMEERQGICAALRILDASRASEYESEIVEISNQLALDDGQLIVDRTRIHVDTAALERWAVKELSEDYARYRDLVTVDVGTVQDFDEILKEIGAQTYSPRVTFAPKTEADAVLIGLLYRYGEEFMNNTSFGLDFYLSQRIRHQSFVGLIRGPLEFANLITTRESESGRYRRNDFWIDKFSCCSQETLNKLDIAFTACATKFDETLIAAKDKSFHVVSAEKPTGLLRIDFTPQLVDIARAIVRMDTDISDFIATASTMLWISLEPSLQRARQFISEDMKTEIADSFDGLRATVRTLAELDPAFLSFDMEIGRRSTEVQHALDDAARWFSRLDIEANKRLFTLHQIVKIATDSALKSQRAFQPEIESLVDGDLQMTPSNLVFVHDVLFVALDNVRAHSGVKKPKVRIDVKTDIEAETLTIEVLSETKPQNLVEKERELNEIRQMIEAGGSGRRTRREGGSGFAKLAAVVAQSSNGRLSFGFDESGQFNLSVTYSLVIPDKSLGGVSAS